MADGAEEVEEVVVEAEAVAGEVEGADVDDGDEVNSAPGMVYFVLYLMSL